MCELVSFKMLLFGSHCFQICRFETSGSCILTNAIEAGPWEWRNLAPDSISLGAKLLNCRTRGLAVVTQGGHFGLNFTVVPSLVVALVYRSGPTNVWCTGLNMANSVQLVEIEPNTGAKHSGCQWTWWRMSDTMQVYTFCVKNGNLSICRQLYSIISERWIRNKITNLLLQFSNAVCMITWFLPLGLEGVLSPVCPSFRLSVRKLYLVCVTTRNKFELQRASRTIGELLESALTFEKVSG